MAIRVEGDPLAPRGYKVFGACIFGLIGPLPPTLQSRSIPINLKRATAEEVARLQTFRSDRPPAICAEIAAKFARWADDNKERLAQAEPDMTGMINRRRDNWRVLFAVADVCGGDWPRRIRAAAQLANGRPDALPQNLELLTDIQSIVADVDCVSSSDLLGALVALDSRPWADWKAGKPMTAKALANELKPFGIFPSSDGDRRGYSTAAMADAFARYIPPVSVNASETQQNRAQVAKSNASGHGPTDTLKNGRNPHGDCITDALTHRDTPLGSVGSEPDPDDWSFHLDDVEADRKAARQ